MRVGPAWIEVKGELAVESKRHRHQSPSCYYPRLLTRGKGTFEWQIIQVLVSQLCICNGIRITVRYRGPSISTGNVLGACIGVFEPYGKS